MPRFENNILGLIPKEEWLDMGFRVNRPNDPIDGLFGDDKTDNLVAAWQSIANEYQIPVMAQFHGFDTEAQTTFRVPIDNHNIEKGLIKVKINQSERMRALTRAGVQNDQMYDYVINDGIRLADQVVTRTKVAKNELMATGKITIKENNLDLTVDYGVPGDQTGYSISFDESEDIFEQIQAIINDAINKGTIINGILTSKQNITAMRRHPSVQKAINGNNGAGAMVSRSALLAFLDEEFGITKVIENDLTYGSSASIGEDGRPQITQSRYFPKDKITFFSTNPSGKMGIGLWGNPPEVDNGQLLKASASGVSPYVYISQKMEWDPAVLWTKASGLFIPVLYNPNSLFIATVQGDALKDVVPEGMDGELEPYGGKKVKTYQSDITVLGNKEIAGKLMFVQGGLAASGPLAGDGYFLALHLTNIDSNVTSLKAGLEPSAGTGLVEMIDDPDKSIVMKITDKNTQKFKVVSSDGSHVDTQTFDLSGLTLQSAGA